MYYERFIDKYLSEWAARAKHKPVLLRGARQVGKSTAVRHLGETFAGYVEINFEKQPVYKTLFEQDLDVTRIVPLMEAIAGKPIIPGKTLLFLDEVQECPKSIMSLRFFKEDMPDLHVIAAGSLLEFALSSLPTFGVGRIHSMFMYPMSFDEFLKANGQTILLNARNQASPRSPLPNILHERLISLLRTYMLVGGMPEAVDAWISTHSYLQCRQIQDDIIVSYEADFPKYMKRVDPDLLRLTMRSSAVQATKKFVYSKVSSAYRTDEIKKATEMLIQAGLLIPVDHSNANGVPLGSGADESRRKILFLDTGLMLRLLNMAVGDISQITEQILTASVADVVNKGIMAETVAGLEMLRCQPPDIRSQLYYWVRQNKSSQAEVDYVTSTINGVLPIEVKSGIQGGMKSLWMFMREKGLSKAVRCSLENFNTIDFRDTAAVVAPAGSAAVPVRHVIVCPLYAMSMFPAMLNY